MNNCEMPQLHKHKQNGHHKHKLLSLTAAASHTGFMECSASLSSLTICIFLMSHSHVQKITSDIVTMNLNNEQDILLLFNTVKLVY